MAGRQVPDHVGVEAAHLGRPGPLRARGGDPSWAPATVPGVRADRRPLLRRLHRSSDRPICPRPLRLLMFKADGGGARLADAGVVKPQNWMTPPTVIEEEPRRDRRAQARRRDRGPARHPHRRGALRRHPRHGRGRRAREGRRRARPPGGAGRRAGVLRRGLPARAARVADRHRARSTSCAATRTTAGSRSRSSASATIDAVEQLTRYLERIRLDPAHGATAAACSPPSRSSRRRGCSPRAAAIDCVEVDLAVVRGEREPDLTLFA